MVLSLAVLRELYLAPRRVLLLDFFIMRNAMCHCEEQSRRGYIVKAMKRCFCLG